MKRTHTRATRGICMQHASSRRCCEMNGTPPRASSIHMAAQVSAAWDAQPKGEAPMMGIQDDPQPGTGTTSER